MADQVFYHERPKGIGKTGQVLRYAGVGWLMPSAELAPS